MPKSATLMLLVLAITAGAAAPGCGLKKRYRCTASASYLGKVRTGKGDDFDSEERAKKFARTNVCEEYCLADDPDVDAAYRKARDPSKPDDHVGRLNVIKNPPVKAVYDACTSRCEAALQSAPFDFKCEHSGI